MGYELETPTRDFHAPIADLRRFEHAALDASRRLADELARGRLLHGQVDADDPKWLAAQVRMAAARRRWREATDALIEIATAIEVD